MVLLDLLTLGLWSKLGRLVHYGVDAILISTILAGIRRSTGLTPSFKSEKIAGDSNETQKWVSRYLAVGETAMDWAVVTAGQSGWFERNR
ncbi:hypothetical protein KVR01_006985 [Diaporthe batatas]|uniref:uncharacterized protein n=1 Tax=Diaporthe batatas TaxID=748121 RepID=UPI001D0373F3|nr:uncharacterized protein KVR01_006985 [Diaporthe batatas]KAG8163688.1 hypothetical protein KVR01_006985 [Diaporthe batatas]KAI7780550.1 hypothetical protein LA080_015951 [Diaporthe eres]